MEQVRIILHTLLFPYFWAGDDGECVHDSVGEFLSDFGDEKGSHPTSGATSQRVRQLKPLKAIAGFGLFANHIQDRVYQLGSLRG